MGIEQHRKPVPPPKERAMQRSRTSRKLATIAVLAVLGSAAYVAAAGQPAPSWAKPVNRHPAAAALSATTTTAAGSGMSMAAVSGSIAALSFPVSRTLSRLSTPSLPRPRYLDPITDPTFGTRVTRVSDRTAMGVDLTGSTAFVALRNSYAKKQAWNSDGSLLLLGISNPAPLLDGNTYEFRDMISLPTDATWSNTDPDVILGVQATSGDLVRYDVWKGRTTVEAHLAGYRRLSLGDGEGNLSDDDRWVVLHGTTTAGGHDMILIDRWTGTRRVRHLAAAPNWIGMSHTGRYVVVSYNTAGMDANHGTVAFDRNLGFLRTIDARVSHGDLAVDGAGAEVYVAGNDCTVDAPVKARCSRASALAAFPLGGGRSYPVIAASTGYNPHGEHVSGRASGRPGWVVISDSGASGEATYPGLDQAFAVRVSPTASSTAPTVQPFAMLHHERGLSYISSAMASVDPTGTRIVWGSEWEGGAPAPVYAYVAERPAPAADNGGWGSVYSAR
jgi:hypothetical protein